MTWTRIAAVEVLTGTQICYIFWRCSMLQKETKSTEEQSSHLLIDGGEIEEKNSVLDMLS